MDNEDVFELFDNCVPFELSLREALIQGLITPFKYYGIRDDMIDFSDKNPNLIRELSNSIHTDFIKDEIEKKRPKGKLKTIAFCKSVEHAGTLSEAISTYGYSTVSLSGNSTITDIIKLFNDLQNDKEYSIIIFIGANMKETIINFEINKTNIINNKIILSHKKIGKIEDFITKYKFSDIDTVEKYLLYYACLYNKLFLEFIKDTAFFAGIKLTDNKRNILQKYKCIIFTNKFINKDIKKYLKEISKFNIFYHEYNKLELELEEDIIKLSEDFCKNHLVCMILKYIHFFREEDNGKDRFAESYSNNEIVDASERIFKIIDRLNSKMYSKKRESDHLKFEYLFFKSCKLNKIIDLEYNVCTFGTSIIKKSKYKYDIITNNYCRTIKLGFTRQAFQNISSTKEGKKFSSLFKKENPIELFHNHITTMDNFILCFKRFSELIMSKGNSEIDNEALNAGLTYEDYSKQYISQNLTVHDINHFKNLFYFIRLCDLGSDVLKKYFEEYFLKEDNLLDFLCKIFNNKDKALEFLSLTLCKDLSLFNLYKTPFLKLNDIICFSFNQIEKANLTRNLIDYTRKLNVGKFNSSSKQREKIYINNLKNAFNNISNNIFCNKKFGNYDIDLCVKIDNIIYIFECKSFLQVTDSEDLRRATLPIRKAERQLDILRNLNIKDKIYQYLNIEKDDYIFKYGIIITSKILFGNDIMKYPILSFSNIVTLCNDSSLLEFDYEYSFKGFNKKNLFHKYYNNELIFDNLIRNHIYEYKKISIGRYNICYENPTINQVVADKLSNESKLISLESYKCDINLDKNHCYWLNTFTQLMIVEREVRCRFLKYKFSIKNNHTFK